MVKLIGLFSLILIFIAGTVMAENEGRIYGKITTTDGDVYEGLIRWDKNEGNWVKNLQINLRENILNQTEGNVIERPLLKYSE